MSNHWLIPCHCEFCGIELCDSRETTIHRHRRVCISAPGMADHLDGFSALASQSDITFDTPSQMSSNYLAAMDDVREYYESRAVQQRPAHKGEEEQVDDTTTESIPDKTFLGSPSSTFDNNHAFSDDGGYIASLCEKDNSSNRVPGTFQSHYLETVQEDLYSEDSSDDDLAKEEEDRQERIYAAEEERTGSPVVPLQLSWLRVEDDCSMSSSSGGDASSIPDDYSPNLDECFLDFAPMSLPVAAPRPLSESEPPSFPTEGLPQEPDYSVEMNPVHESLFCLLKRKCLPGQTMFDLILRFAHGFAPDQFPIVDYRTIRKKMEKKYGHCAGGRPQLSPVTAATLPVPRPVLVPHYKSIDLLNRLLSNPIITKDAVFRFNEVVRFNPRTHEFERVYGDFHTADFWRQAEEKFIPAHCRAYPPDNIPHGLVVLNGFDDGTLCDFIGRNVINPYLVGLANSPPKTRKSYKGWELAGCVSSYPKSGKEKEAERAKVATKYNALKFRHDVVRTIHGELLQLICSEQNRTTGFLRRIPGHPLMHLHFCMGVVIGDTMGHNSMCSHHNSHSANLCRHNRDCDIPTSLIDGLNYQCRPANSPQVFGVLGESIRKIDEGKGVTAARNEARYLSMDLAIPALLSEVFGIEEIIGLLGSLPWEKLHMLYLGLMKKDLGCIFSFGFVPDPVLHYFVARLSGMEEGHDASQPPETISKERWRTHSPFPHAEFDRRFRVLLQLVKRQSERNMPRFPRSVGTTDLVRLTGSEYPGLCLMSLICLKGLFTEQWMGSGNQHQTPEDNESVPTNINHPDVLAIETVVRLLPDRQRLSRSSRAPAVHAIIDSYDEDTSTYQVTHYNIQQRLRKESTETVSKDRVEVVEDRWNEVRTQIAADEEQSRVQEQWKKESYNGWLLYCLIVGVPPSYSVSPPVPPTRCGVRITRVDPIAKPVYYPQGSLHGLCVEERDGNGSTKEVIVTTIQEGSLSMDHGVEVGDVIIDSQKTEKLKDPVFMSLVDVGKSLEGIAVKGRTITFLRRVNRVFHSIRKDQLQPTEFKVHGPRIASLLSSLLCLDRMMSRNEYFESDVSALSEFIAFYQRLSLIVTGPIRQTLSKCGACTGKFHAPTHIPRQIRQFGSPENVNGSYLEAALQYKVKKLARLTTRSHERLEADVLERDYEIHLCEPSRYWNDYEPQEKTNPTEVDPDQIFTTLLGLRMLHGNVRFRCSSSEHPAVQHPSTPTTDDNGLNSLWHLSFEGKRKASLMHPLAIGDESPIANRHVHSILQYAERHLYTQADFFVDMQAESAGDTFCHAYRFHPSVYANKESSNDKSPWYDWAVVDLEPSSFANDEELRCQYIDYEDNMDDGSSEDEAGGNSCKKNKNLPNCCIAQIGLGARLSGRVTSMDGNNQHDSLVVLSVRMLRNLRVDMHIPLGLGGDLDESLTVIRARNIRRTAFVVPSVDKLTDSYPDSIYGGRYWVCIPPSDCWNEISKGFFSNILDGRIWW